jgi:carbon-monoxide dehydrogenase small subunit
MILSAKAFLEERPGATEAEVREALAGNLCRCTGYQKIADAVVDAARAVSERR